MSNRVYDVLKYFSQVFLPALTVLVGVIMKTLNVPYTDIVVTIMTAVDAFLGALLKGASDKYYAK